MSKVSSYKNYAILIIYKKIILLRDIVLMKIVSLTKRKNIINMMIQYLYPYLSFTTYKITKTQI